MPRISLALLVVTLACTPTESALEIELELARSEPTPTVETAKPPASEPRPEPISGSGIGEGTIALPKTSILSSTVFSASLTIEGPMSLDDAQATMFDDGPALVRCWADEQPEVDDVRLEVQVGASGTVESFEYDVEAPEFNRCTKRVINTWKFPKRQASSVRLRFDVD